MKEVGLSREDINVLYLINDTVTDFSKYYTKVNGKKCPSFELEGAYNELFANIARLTPSVIVPLGNESLKALTSNYGIYDWRGSILTSKYGKIIPTIHPNDILKDWKIRPACVSDWHKIAQHSKQDIPLIERELIINPTYQEILDEIERFKKEEYVSFDIETESDQITCIGLSSRRDRAMCIPFWLGASGSFWTEEQESEIWKRVKELLESEEPKKVAHNGIYDCEYLWRTIGIKPKLHWDTMLMFHTMYSELPKSLGYLVSIYTDYPYYKYNRKSSDMDTFWRYNCLDACLTMDCFIHLRAELVESNLTQFYNNFVHSLVCPILEMQNRGVRFDTNIKGELKKSTEEEIESLQIKLEQLVGHPLNIHSHKQMTEWLYTEMKVPKHVKKRKTTGKISLVCDEEALYAILANTKDNKIKECINIILSIREKSKILSTYLNVKLDSDKRIRCSYNIAGTETGRMSSSATSRNTGTNLQNIPNGIFKKLFIADEGKVLINADLSQAEARIVAYLSGETRLINVFNEGGDIHKKNASNIYSKPESAISDEERQLAKKAVHASNYGMGPRTFSKQAGITEVEAKRLLNQYFTTYPRIKVWQMQLQAKLKQSRTLTNPFGRKRIFFSKWDDTVAKEGLAFLPQSTVADIITKAMVDLHSKGIELLLQVHDSLVCQCDKNDVDRVCKIVKDSMTIPININGRVLTIPVDVKIGDNWNDMVKYKG